MLVRTIRETEYCEKVEGEGLVTRKRPAGTELDGDRCWVLCKIGVAEPADKECYEKLKADKWPGHVRFAGKFGPAKQEPSKDKGLAQKPRSQKGGSNEDEGDTKRTTAKLADEKSGSSSTSDSA